jgi:hypothetical protein
MRARKRLNCLRFVVTAAYCFVANDIVLAAPPGYVETTVQLNAPPVGLAFGAGGVLYALEGAEFNSNEALLRTILPSGAYGPSFPVVGDDPTNFFVSAIGYDHVTNRVLITDNTGDGRLYAVDSSGARETIAIGIPGITAVAVRSSGEVFVSTAPFGRSGEVRLVDRATGGSTPIVTGLGFGAGMTFDEMGNLLFQDAATTSPFEGRLQRLPITHAATGLLFGTPAALITDTQAAAGVAVDSEGDIFITGSGGLFALEGFPLVDVSFSANDNPLQFATAISFDAGVNPFEPFAGPQGGRLAYMADFGFTMEDSFVTMVTPAASEDFNSDGTIDGRDLSIWGEYFGSSTAEVQEGDADHDGDVDGHDFLRWQRALTLPTSPPEVGAAVPEPACGATLFTAALAGFFQATRAGRRVLRR